MIADEWQIQFINTKPGISDFKRERNELFDPIITEALSLVILTMFCKGICFFSNTVLKVSKSLFAVQSLASNDINSNNFVLIFLSVGQRY